MTHWSLYELEYLHSNFETMSNKEISEVLGKTPQQISWQMIRQGWRRSAIKHWTAAEIQWLRKHAHLGEPGLALALNIDKKKIRTVLRNHRIRTGNKTRFHKGQNPWNAGRHVRMSPKSEFKKGQLPKNTLYDGAIRTRRDKTGAPYQFIRISQGKWVLLHRHMWEQAHGPVPKDMLITFIDGNALNCTLANLKMITKRENAMRNVNRAKAAQSLAESWENGIRYENDEWVAKLMARGDKELQQDLLQNKQLIETKRQQLLLNRKLKQHTTI
jgi:hypothetical protein